jgi:hypothetical protein
MNNSVTILIMEQLFGSKTRVKLLKLFMSNPNRSFYVREITRKIDEQINSVRRELANLLSIGLITSDSTNNKLYYEVDQKYEHYGALRELFTVKKSPATPVTSKPSKIDKVEQSENVEEKIVETEEIKKASVDEKVWDKVGNISGLLYSGAFTRDVHSPVDVMIVGDVPIARAEAAVAELEKQEGKELRYAVMELEEWVYRKQVNDKFWLQVVDSKNLVILDKENLFSKQ